MKIERINEWFGLYADKILKKRWWILTTFVLVMVLSVVGMKRFAYIDVTHGGIYNRLSADYAMNDQLHATLGYDFFHADRGMFTVYDKNSEVFLKLKYSF